MNNKLLFSCLTALVLLSQCGVKGKEIKESPNQPSEVKAIEDIALEAEKSNTPEASLPSADNPYSNVKIVEKEYSFSSKKNDCSIYIKYPVVTQLGDKKVEQSLNKIIQMSLGINDKDCDNEEINKGIEKHSITNDGILSIIVGANGYSNGAARSFSTVWTMNLDLKTGKQLEHFDLFDESKFGEFQLVIDAILEEKLDSINRENQRQNQEYYFPLRSEEVFSIEPSDDLMIPAYSFLNDGIMMHFVSDHNIEGEIFVPRERIKRFLKKRD